MPTGHRKIKVETIYLPENCIQLNDALSDYKQNSQEREMLIHVLNLQQIVQVPCSASCTGNTGT